MEEIEEWRVIKDFPNYMVSSFGRIKSIERYVPHFFGGYHLKKEQILRGSIATGGYIYVSLWNNGKLCSKSIHRLVAEAFIPNPNNFSDVGHINEIKTDNRVNNLYWVSHIGNCNYGNRNKKISEKRRKVILQFSKDGYFIKEWNSVCDITNECGYEFSGIQKCCRGLYKQAYGYIWKYKEKGVA